MPELDDALTTFAAWLNGLHIPYMVIGGFAVTIWGEPRVTRDLDVTISVPADEISKTVELVRSEFTVLVTDALKFVSETRVLPMVVGDVPVDLIFAALPYEDDA